MTESTKDRKDLPSSIFRPVITEDSPVQDIARAFVLDYARSHLDPSDSQYETFSFEDVYVVQFFWILGNWKALISTTLPDGMYYEVSYEKSRGVCRLEAYKRAGHEEVSIDDISMWTVESQARELVFSHIRTTKPVHEDSDPVRVNVYSFAYVYGCWKALLATSLDDGMYYEVTYDPHRHLAYLDPYKLFEMKEFAIPARRGS